MDTKDPYFSPGDEELQVWVFENDPGRVSGYIKGVFNEAHIHQFGTIQENGRWVSEKTVQVIAESLLDDVIFFFVHVKTTTDV